LAWNKLLSKPVGGVSGWRQDKRILILFILYWGVTYCCGGIWSWIRSTLYILTIFLLHLQRH